VIPRAHITAWRAHAPWSTDAQVEQDLVIARVMVEVFSAPLLSSRLAFRGGTDRDRSAPVCVCTNGAGDVLFDGMEHGKLRV
jgi:hypothetical protein